MIDHIGIEQCLMLSREVSSYYEYLKEGNHLILNGQGNDIYDLLSNYLPIGIDFTEAESLLKKCGFQLSERPGRKFLSSKRTDKFDVLATSSNMVTSSNRWVTVEVLVSLTPTSPDNYDIVKSMSASLLVKTL